MPSGPDSKLVVLSSEARNTEHSTLDEFCSEVVTLQSGLPTSRGSWYLFVILPRQTPTASPIYPIYSHPPTSKQLLGGIAFGVLGMQRCNTMQL